MKVVDGGDLAKMQECGAADVESFTTCIADLVGSYSRRLQHAGVVNKNISLVNTNNVSIHIAHAKNSDVSPVGDFFIQLHARDFALGVSGCP